MQLHGCPSHTTNAWTPAVFDHSGVAPGTCISCHDGSIAEGKHNLHIPSNNQCDACHTTIAWIPANFDHDSVSPGTCNSCHDGVTAEGPDNGHFQTSQSCDACHTTDFWEPDIFAHSSPGYPGDHSGNLACTDCHGGNSEVVTWDTPTYQPDCAGCHANDYERDEHTKFRDTDYTVSELRDCAGSCHEYTDSSQSTIKEFRPGPEHTVRGEF